MEDEELKFSSQTLIGILFSRSKLGLVPTVEDFNREANSTSVNLAWKPFLY